MERLMVEMPITLKTILDDVQTMTPINVEQIDHTLDPPGEDKVLVVMPERLRLFWALSFDYLRKSNLAMHAAHFDAQNDEQRKTLLAECKRWDALAELVRDLCWVECRMLAGEQTESWAMGTIGLRKGFVLVRSKSDEGSDDDGQEGILQALQALKGIATIVRQRIVEGHEEEPPQEKKKPQ